MYNIIQNFKHQLKIHIDNEKFNQKILEDIRMAIKIL